jgi:hypothetical protein
VRGSVAKLLRWRAHGKYREMLAAGQVNQPENLDHLLHQKRVLYRLLKKAYKSLSLDARTRYLESLRKSATSSALHEPK